MLYASRKFTTINWKNIPINYSGRDMMTLQLFHTYYEELLTSTYKMYERKEDKRIFIIRNNSRYIINYFNCNNFHVALLLAC